MTDQLKQCPFCEGEAELRTDGDDLNYPIWIQCTKCQAGVEPFPNKEFAILEWNTRHIPDGYQLVPIEPSEAMRKAAWDQHYCNNEGALTLYKAMLKAAGNQND